MGFWEDLAVELQPQLAVVEERDELVAQLRPCWIFVSSVRQAKAEGRTEWPEPPVGAAKLGGLPDLPLSASWPLTSSGESMDFLAQVRLDDGPPLPGLPATGSVLFFTGGDDPNDNIEHSTIYVQGNDITVRTPRPQGPRFDDSQDYHSLPLTWIPSLSILRSGRYYHSLAGDEVSTYEIQRAINQAAWKLAGIEEPSFQAITTFGGWPADDESHTALRAYIADSDFADHGAYIADFQRCYDFIYGQRPLDELRANPDNPHWVKLADLIEQGDPFLNWIRDPAVDHPSGIARWQQLLSLDSHMELGMCFWDAGRYEFTCHDDGMSHGSFRTRMDLVGFG